MRENNFYPGPSKVYTSISEVIYEAYMKGIMSINHRSDVFMDLMDKTKQALRSSLNIPKGYEIAFLSSATESWEVISQSLVKKKSQHFYNGAFGKKWFDYASMVKEAEGVPFGIEEVLPLQKLDPAADVICITQNETSNATQVHTSILKKLRKSTNAIIALDVTSSLAGINLDLSQGDIWYASVQKCFGLPAGLGIIIMSPRAQKRAEKVNDQIHYNSLLNVLTNSRKNQTHYTPNVLNIYLLYKTQKRMKPIDIVSVKTQKRADFYYQTFEKSIDFDFLIKNKKVRSDTVIALQHKDPSSVIAKAFEKRIILGKGYGQWKDHSLRIANFPAIKTIEIEKLIGFFEKEYK